MGENRLVILGLDGVPYELLKDLSQRNIMPNFKELQKNGQFQKMESSIPEISSVSWSSIITGKNPGEHGIFGFTDMIPGSYTISFPNYNNLKEKPFWEMNKEKSVIINVPFTYPVKKINGFIISGFISLDFNNAVYPKSYIDFLKKIDYKIDVDSKKVYKSIYLFYEDLIKTFEKRIYLYREIWNKIQWNVFMLVFTGTDRLGHFLWDSYKNKNHEYHDKFLEYFKKIDEIIGEINNKLSGNDKLILLSDHGMEEIKTNVNINSYLEQNGFIKLGENLNQKYKNMKNDTKAFALDPARIYLNKKGKFPNGSVNLDKEEKIITELIESLEKLNWNGKKVINKIFKKSDIYYGRFINNAPDLVLIPNSGFSLRGNIGKKELFQEDNIICGMHTQQNAFFLLNDKNFKENIPKKLHVENISSIINLLRRGE